MKHLLCAKCFMDIISVNPMVIQSVRSSQHHLSDKDVGDKKVQGFTQGSSTVKWQNQELSLVWMKQHLERLRREEQVSHVKEGTSIWALK